MRLIDWGERLFLVALASLFLQLRAGIGCHESLTQGSEPVIGAQRYPLTRDRSRLPMLMNIVRSAHGDAMLDAYAGLLHRCFPQASHLDTGYLRWTLSFRNVLLIRGQLGLRSDGFQARHEGLSQSG